MHIPKQFEEKDVSVLCALMKSHPFATWVSTCEGELDVNHIPFVLDASQGKYGVLKGHVARVNPVWKTLEKNPKSLIVFQGAESYISPSWYPSKQKHGKVVPTWNYAVVHVKGSIKIVEDKIWLLDHLNDLTDEHEATQKSPWKVTDAPTDFNNHLIKAIVGLELSIESLEGKWKYGQNKSKEDKLGLVAGLESKNDLMSLEMAEYIKGTIE